MNKNRRKALDEVVKKIEELQSGLSELLGDLDSIREEEEEYRDNIPENMQDSEKYWKADAAVDALMAAYDALDAADSDMDEAAGNILVAIE